MDINSLPPYEATKLLEEICEIYRQADHIQQALALAKAHNDLDRLNETLSGHLLPMAKAAIEQSQTPEEAKEWARTYEERMLLEDLLSGKSEDEAASSRQPHTFGQFLSYVLSALKTSKTPIERDDDYTLQAIYDLAHYLFSSGQLCANDEDVPRGMFAVRDGLKERGKPLIQSDIEKVRLLIQYLETDPEALDRSSVIPTGYSDETPEVLKSLPLAESNQFVEELIDICTSSPLYQEARRLAEKLDPINRERAEEHFGQVLPEKLNEMLRVASDKDDLRIRVTAFASSEEFFNLLMDPFIPIFKKAHADLPPMKDMRGDCEAALANAKAQAEYFQKRLGRKKYKVLVEWPSEFPQPKMVIKTLVHLSPEQKLKRDRLMHKVMQEWLAKNGGGEVLAVSPRAQAAVGMGGTN
jgi:hypothetical protein